jgi:sugar lactone lactonase YvrE
MKVEEFDLCDLLTGSSNAFDKVDVVQARLVIDCHCELAEGILYDDKQHAVLWTDILGKRFHCLQLASSSQEKTAKVRHQTFELSKKLCSFGMVQGNNPSVLLCAWEDGFQLYDMEKGEALSEMSEGEDVNPHKGTTRLNDGRVDPSGQRFVCGGYYGDMPGIKMKVFKVEQGGDKKLQHEAIADEMEVTNSISWSLDGKTMYLTDSPTRKIYRHEYDADQGTLSTPTFLHEKSAALGVPDGSCVDAEGYLWNAVWRSGAGPAMVQRIDPVTGRVVFTVHMPDGTSQVTCCCFGGEDMDILFISSAAESRDRKIEPHAGGIYAVKLPFKGRKESRLQFAY